MQRTAAPSLLTPDPLWNRSNPQAPRNPSERQVLPPGSEQSPASSHGRPGHFSFGHRRSQQGAAIVAYVIP
jgi:hypothetical protein